MTRTMICCLVVTFAWCAASPAAADESSALNLEALNRRIGVDYQAIMSRTELVDAISQAPLLLYGEAHDQLNAAQQFVALVDALRERSSRPWRIGIEFVDRGDIDIMNAFLAGVLDEHEFLLRIMPSSLLRSPQIGDAHMALLRYARDEDLDVIPLESRPAGARPERLRNSEIRWNLSHQLARYPQARLAVLYGVDHILGDDPIQAGLAVRPVVVTSYGDSAQAAFLRREGRDPYAGEVLQLREGVYLQALGGPPGERRLLGMDFGGNDELLLSIEKVYVGDHADLPALIEALMHQEIRWRRAAAHALEFAAQQTLNYDAEAPERQRLQAQRRWEAWLTQQLQLETTEDSIGGSGGGQ